MKLVFAEQAWEDYLHWQATDRKLLQRIHALIKEASPGHVQYSVQTW